ncbi:MAG: HAMP domain-containing histidine kinase [Paenibacillaceae bacterium]|nr:HAMP domain-containing histidine kinase [Paenibacillaceae bacterium]
MKAQTKLSFVLFAFGLTVFLGASFFSRGLGFLPGNDASLSVTAVLLFIAVIALAGFSYLIALTFCRRLVQLAAKAKQVQLHPSLRAIEISGAGNDEIASVAGSFNELIVKLTKGEEARNQMVADVAHELRTPVAIVRGHLETMLKGAVELTPDNLLPLLDETKRMSRLLQDMRDLNLAEAGQLSLVWSWVPLGAMLREILSIMELEAESEAVSLSLNGDWDGELYCDAARIKQVLINLIGNAIRYGRTGGLVEVAYHSDAETIRIAVSDNGPGISPERLPYLFKRFYRLEDSRSRSSGGTGLGLAIAKEFVEAHGGTIRADSVAGEGTTFELSLPLYPLAP